MKPEKGVFSRVAHVLVVAAAQAYCDEQRTPKKAPCCHSLKASLKADAAMIVAIGLCFGGEGGLPERLGGDLMNGADSELGTCWGSLKLCMRMVNIGLYIQSPKSGKDPIELRKEMMTREEGLTQETGVPMMSK